MNLLKVSASPHIKSEETTRTIMTDVLIALSPALIWAVYIFGWRSLTLSLVSVFACIIFELLFQKLMKRPVRINDCSAAVTGLLIAFNLPVSAPIPLLLVGDFFAIIIVKELFGGIGKNFVNPALMARVFLFSWPDLMARWTDPLSDKISAFSLSPVIDTVSSATPLASLKSGIISDIPVFDMFIGNMPGCIGEVSALLLLLGGLYLLARKVITFHTPLAYIGTVAVITYFFPQVLPAPNFMLSELFSGGLFLGAFFMATDYVTSPATKSGKLLFGFGCGAITILLRYFGGYPEGVSFSILIMNLLVPYIDSFTKPRVFGGVTHGKA